MTVTQLIIGLILWTILLGVLLYFQQKKKDKLFRKNLKAILYPLESFNADAPQLINFPPAKHKLLTDLTTHLQELINRIIKNYQASRQFTQNAAHELQTPLAIIKAQIELLIQSPNIKEKEVAALGTILSNTNRLSRLNSALILLSRIEHQRFTDEKEISIRQTTETILQHFDDLIQLNELEIIRKMPRDISLKMSETLAEIMISNLLQNAIRYNLENGFIDIRLSEQSLTISNPGAELTIPPEQLFKRFNRASDNDEGLGLGLSIVQRICQQYNFTLRYEQYHGIHKISILFPS